jgi:hypothetical protein
MIPKTQAGAGAALPTVPLSLFFFYLVGLGLNSWLCAHKCALLLEPHLQSILFFFGGCGGGTLARQVLLLLEPLPQPFFVIVFFEIGAHGLFACG